MVYALLTCFHSPKFESSFSLMNSVISSKTSKMNIPTFDAIQSVKYHLAEKKSSVAYFAKKDFLHDQVDKKLVRNLRVSYKTYENEKRVAIQDRVGKLQKNKGNILSKEMVKKLCANAAKRQRLKHKRNIHEIEKQHKGSNIPKENKLPSEKSLSSEKSVNKHISLERSVELEVSEQKKARSAVKRTSSADPLISESPHAKKQKKTDSLTIKEMFQRALAKKDKV